MTRLDAVCSGPSAGLTVPDILAVLDLLEGRHNAPPLTVGGSDARIKTVIPSVVGGFQGVTIANFVNLGEGAQYRVFNHLHQFGETIGHKCEEIRQRRAKQLLENHNGVEEVARAFVTILPPIEYLIATKGTASIGLELMRENEYWAGYHLMSKERLRSLRDVEDAEGILAHINGEAFRLQVKLVADLPSLDPVFTRLRMRSNMTSITSSLDHSNSPTVLRRNDLLKVHESLERQIAEGIKVQSACKALPDYR